MRSEQVVLVNEADQQIGLAEKMLAHEQGLLHRAFSVFILRKHKQEFEVLLQQRHHDKYHCGALWTNTCCSHPRADEDVQMAAERRLQEEVGLSINLSILDAFTYRAEFSNGLIEYEYDYVLLGYYHGETINVNPEEVQDHKWISLTALQQDLVDNPSAYTPWLQPALNIVQEYLEQIS